MIRPHLTIRWINLSAEKDPEPTTVAQLQVDGTTREEVVISQGYLAYHVKRMVDKICAEMEKWEAQQHTMDALMYIAAVKDILEDHRRYLYQNAETRLLVSSLDLIFENNLWEDMSTAQVGYIRKELGRFASGKIDRKDLVTFSQQMHRGGVAFLK